MNSEEARAVAKVVHENGPVVVDFCGEDLAWRPLDYGTWTPLAFHTPSVPDEEGRGQAASAIVGEVMAYCQVSSREAHELAGLVITRLAAANLLDRIATASKGEGCRG